MPGVLRSEIPSPRRSISAAGAALELASGATLLLCGVSLLAGLFYRGRPLIALFDLIDHLLRLDRRGLALVWLAAHALVAGWGLVTGAAILHRKPWARKNAIIYTGLALAATLYPAGSSFTGANPAAPPPSDSFTPFAIAAFYLLALALLFQPGAHREFQRRKV